MVGGLKVSAVVGTILNAINQGDRLLFLRLEEVVWWKIGLTFLVPFCVSVYAATRIRMIFAPGFAAYRDAVLVCRRCQQEGATVRTGETIPGCPRCGAKTAWRG